MILLNALSRWSNVKTVLNYYGVLLIYLHCIVNTAEVDVILSDEKEIKFS